jgi:hypothetical protein
VSEERAPEPREDGPTEVVETDDGELIERLSGGTATLLLVWLIGIGALSTLLATWLYVWFATGERLGADALFGGFGIYTSIAGATGPCVLWLTGRAQGHTLPWFLATSAKVALVMVGMVLLVIVLAIGVMVGIALVLSVVWALATWGADRWIARARLAS